MPLQSSQTITLPEVSVPTYVFGTPSEPLAEDPIILDPALPETRFLTLSTYRKWSQRFAAGLHNAGFKKGDRLLFIAGNSIAYPIVLMGTLMAGGALSGAPPSLDIEKLTRQASDVEPTFILASDEGYAKSVQVATTLSLPEDRVFRFGPECLYEDGREDLNGWQSLLAESMCSFDWRPFSEHNDIAVINFTSGSTGHAKGVKVSHRNMIANAVQYTAPQQSNPAAPENGNQVNWVMWAPMFHVIGQNQYCIIAPRRGIRNYIMESFDLDLLLKYTEKYGATEMLLMPPVIIAMLHHPLTRKYDLSKVNVVMSGGAPLRSSVIELFKKVMPNKDLVIRQGWGMTELTCIVCDIDPLDRTSEQSIGKLLPNCEGRVMAADGQQELGPNEPGEVWIRSPNVTQGYLKRPHLEAGTFYPDGWLRTGDFGYYDSEERWYIRDRIQDVIRTRDGRYVLPTDLESALLDIPGVLDAGVTSVSLDDSGNVNSLAPRGFVVLDPKIITASVSAVEAAFNAKMKAHEWLTGGLYEVKEIPRLPNAKVHRAALRLIQIEQPSFTH